MTLTPSGNPLALQDAGTNSSATTDPLLLDKDITVGSTTMNTMQAWTDIAYSPFGGTTYYTTYVKDLTGGTMYGYSPSFVSTAWQYTSLGHGSSSTMGPGGNTAFYDGGGPSSGSSGSYYSQSSTYSGANVMGSQPSSLFGGGPWGQTPTTAAGTSGQFHESFTQTYSYQGRTHNGYGININNSTTSIGSFGGSNYSNQYWTGSTGIKWNVQQVLWGKNTKSTGNFPNLNGPYSGSHETGSNAGNFVYLLITRSDGVTATDPVASAMSAEQVFSHMRIGSGTSVFKGGHQGEAHSPGLTGYSPSRSGNVAYTANANFGFYYLWTGVSDSVIDGLGTTGTRAFEIYGPRATITYNNGIAEEHGGADSADVKISDYLKGASAGYVAASHPAASIKTAPQSAATGLNASFSDYYGTSELAGAAEDVLGVLNSSDGHSTYYPNYGAGQYAYSYYYIYQVGNALTPAYGTFRNGGVNGTNVANPVRTINNKEQRITQAYLNSNPSGFILGLTFSPTSGNSSDVIASGDFTSFEWKMPTNSSAIQTLTTYHTSPGGSQASSISATFGSTITTASVTGQIVPSRTVYWYWLYSTYASNSGSNLGRYWATNGFTTGYSWDRDFEIDFS